LVKFVNVYKRARKIVVIGRGIRIIIFTEIYKNNHGYFRIRMVGIKI